MKPFMLLLAIFVAITTCEDIDVAPRQATICIEPVDRPTPVQRLAEVQYDPVTLAVEVISFNTLGQVSEDGLVRIGTCDAKFKTWSSSTSVTAAATFSKGYSPTITLHLDGRGDILGVSCKSSRIDAGHSRDFGPKAKVLKMGDAKSPELNKPVVLSKEGKIEAVEPEKTFLQKYWMVFLGITVVLMMSGGGEK